MSTDPDDKEKPQIAPTERLMIVEIMPGTTGRTTWIVTGMTDEEPSDLVKLLSENHDVFAWSPDDLVGIDPKVTTHNLVGHILRLPAGGTTNDGAI